MGSIKLGFVFWECIRNFDEHQFYGFSLNFHFSVISIFDMIE